MIRTLRVDGRGECTRGGEEQIALWQQDSDSRIWIDLCGGDPQATRLFAPSSCSSSNPETLLSAFEFRLAPTAAITRRS